MPTPLSLRRITRAGLMALLLLPALALSGCSAVAVIKTAAPATSGFDTRYGNNPMAAADAAALQSALAANGQLWSIRLDTQPAAAGNVKVTDQNVLIAARGKVSSFTVTLTATAQSTIDGVSSRGAAGEQDYLQRLVQAIARAGYVKVTSVRVDLYFRSSHHGVLTWKSGVGFAYTVLDGKP